MKENLSIPACTDTIYASKSTQRVDFFISLQVSISLNIADIEIERKEEGERAKSKEQRAKKKRGGWSAK